MNRDSKLIFEAYKGSPLEASFDRSTHSPTAQELELASEYIGSNEKLIAISNIASNLFNLLTGKQGAIKPHERQALEEIGQSVLNLLRRK